MWLYITLWVLESYPGTLLEQVLFAMTSLQPSSPLLIDGKEESDPLKEHSFVATLPLI